MENSALNFRGGYTDIFTVFASPSSGRKYTWGCWKCGSGKCRSGNCKRRQQRWKLQLTHDTLQCRQRWTQLWPYRQYAHRELGELWACGFEIIRLVSGHTDRRGHDNTPLPYARWSSVTWHELIYNSKCGYFVCTQRNCILFSGA